MCGITGIFGNLSKDVLSESVHKMSETLIHRGPNDGGIWVDCEDGIAFGHRRLSILDLSSAGSQPMTSVCGRFVVVFNGEIYNHLHLRRKMESLFGSISWRGHSDTETLVYLFSKWGIEETIKHLVGMFAIAVWDKKTKKISLIRDRVGEKPLYYGWSNQVFFFGSELKSLRAYKGFNNLVDRNALSLYMQYMYVPTPYSIYENIYKLEPGCILQIDKKCILSPPEIAPSFSFRSYGITLKQWYSLSDVAKNGQSDLIQDEIYATELLEKTLLNSVSSQLITDVPIGAFLSGGIDSSIIVSLMQKLKSSPVKTFTIGFEDSNFNEAIYAKKVAKHLGTDHYELYVKASDTYSVIPKLPYLYDEPFADSSQIPTFLVSQLAREHVTVCLSGDAGDELFGGYNRYLWGKSVWNKLNLVPLGLRKNLGHIMQKIPTSVWDSAGYFLPNKYSVVSVGDKVHKMAHRLKVVNSLDDMYHSLVNEGFKGEDLIISSNPLDVKVNNPSIVSGISESEHRMMLWDSISYLPDDILTKVDRAAMGSSLETRIPMLDYRVIELAWRLPLSMKIKDAKGKHILRKILYKYVPNELIDRPKAGFAIPVGQWLRGPLREWAEDLIDDHKIDSEGYFNHKLVRNMWNEHISGKCDWTSRIWAILMFQAWLESQK